MSSFTTPLDVRLNDDGRHWTLLAPFVYHIGAYPSEEIVSVPAGYTTDFASIPRIFWSLIGGPTGKYGKAAVVHDYLYDCGGLIQQAVDSDGGARYHRYSKAEADRIFEQAMAVLKVGQPRRLLMYLAVRVGGVGKFPTER